MFNRTMYNPYATYNTGLIRKGINWSSLLANTQKTLGVINQAIPVFHQVRPILNNAKTMFKIAGALKDDDSKGIKNPTTPKSKEIIQKEETNSPMFFQ